MSFRPLSRSLLGLCALGLAGLLGAPLAAQQAAQVVVDEVRLVEARESQPVIGRFVPRQAGDVAARINGAVDAFYVEVGDVVTRGQLLAKLDDGIMQARRAQAEARLTEAEAGVATARAELNLRWQELNRLEKLQDSPAFSQARYDDQRQTVAVANAEVAAREAAVANAVADLALAELELSYTEIRAPYSGVVVQRFTETGAYVNNGSPLLSMIADGNLEIEADVPYQQIAPLTPDRKVEIELSDGTRHSAKVRAVIPDENPLTRTRAVRFVPELGETVIPIAAGQSAIVLVPSGGEGNRALTVHKDAVIPQTGRTIVFVVKDGAAEARSIEIGRAFGTRFEVLSGLEPGDLAVVRGNERLREGQPVEIAGEPVTEATQ